MRTNFSSVLLLLASTAGAQSPQSNWYFGFGAGLTFNTPTPTALTDGAMSTDEGCASISDSTGSLLFYTDGESVWDRTHVQMPNGWGLGGGFSSTQSGLVVPFQNAPGFYYLFTVPNEAGYWGGIFTGLTYSIIDMAGNGGLGDVTIKNIALADSMVEKLSATRHANGKDVWVLTHEWNSDAYFAWLVTCTGMEGPVISHAGRMMEEDGTGGYPTIGCMQFSPYGDRLAAAWTQFGPGFSGNGQMDILSFDRMSGTVSNAIPITHAVAGWDIRAYGTCFSPDGSRLYLSESGLQSGIGFSRVLQYDMLSTNIPTSEVQVAGANIEAHGTMQKGPDGMVYIARTNGFPGLSRIQFPNALGAACGYQDVAVSIAPNLSTWGLPNNWDSDLPQPAYDIFPFNDTLVCNALITLDATYDHPFHIPHYLWSTGATDPSITIDSSGVYWVSIMLPCDTLTDTVQVSTGSISLDLGPDARLCEGQAQVFEGPLSAATLLWEDGSSAPIREVDEEGEYWLLATDSAGCVASDTVKVTVSDCDCTLYLPNAFTPNGDGINDLFGLVHDCDLLLYDLSVFDRWGQEIFHTDDPFEAWNGTVKGREVQQSVYAWKMAYRFFDGEHEQGSHRDGHVVVVR